MARGRLAEELLELTHRRLALAGTVYVRHMEPGVRVSGRDARGAQLRFAAGGPPDYMGTLAGGRSVVFELKSTEGETFTWTKAGRGRRQLTRARQAADLESHGQLGAMAGLLVAFTRPVNRASLMDFVWVHWSRASLLMEGTWRPDRLALLEGAARVSWVRGDPDWLAAARHAEQGIGAAGMGLDRMPAGHTASGPGRG